MQNNKEIIKITDKFGFIHDVELEHSPHFGFSIARNRNLGNIIDHVELGRILEPIGDDDLEWERYHERFSEWADEVKVNIVPKCLIYFNSKK